MCKKDKNFSFFRRSFVSPWIILAFDIALGVFCALVSYALVAYFFESLAFSVNGSLIGFFLVVALSTLISDLIFKPHKQVFRYSSLRIGMKLGFAVLLNTAIVGLGYALLSNNYAGALTGKELGLFVTFYLLLLYMSMLLFRGSLVVLARYLVKSSDTPVIAKKRVFIYGIKEESVRLATLLDEGHEYYLQGYLTQMPGQEGHEIEGKPIFYIDDASMIGQLAKEKGVIGVIFPSKSDFLAERENFIIECEKSGLNTYLGIGIGQTTSATVMKEGVRRIKIEDLLFRDVISQNKDEIAKLYKGKTVMVTGAAGSIGSELAKQIASFGAKKLILFEYAETGLHEIRLYLEHYFPDLNLVPRIGDIRRRDIVERAFREFRPDIVLHAAAYKHVPLMEEHPCESVCTNIVGTQNVADMAVKYDAERMVMISTDKAVNPTNVMGACKRACEIYIQSMGKAIEEGRMQGRTIFVTTRFGNVLGSNGSVISLFKDQIASGGPVTVTHPDIVRYFMSIPEACSLVLQAGGRAKKTQIFVFDMGQKHKIVDLARRMIQLSGFEPDKDIKIVYTGLRPGEKLYEEVLATEENTLKTDMDKIRIAQVRDFDYDEIVPLYSKLKEICLTGDNFATVALLKELIPEYISNNSIYESLDHKEVQ